MKSKKEKVSAWGHEHPFAAGMVLAVLFVVFRKGLYFVFLPLPQTIGFRLVHEVLDLIWPVCFVVLFGMAGIFKRKGLFKTLLAGLAMLLLDIVLFVLNMLNLLQVPDFEWYPFGMILFGIFTELAVGFREESVFRGIVTNLFAEKYLKDRRGIFITVFAGAFSFGIMHMGNMLVGQSFADSIIQSISAFFLGAYLSAVYLRGGSIWGVAIIHGLYDMSLDVSRLFTKTFGMDLQTALGSAEKTVYDLEAVASYALLWAVYFVVTLFLLRKSKRDEIIGRCSGNML